MELKETLVRLVFIAIIISMGMKLLTIGYSLLALLFSITGFVLMVEYFVKENKDKKSKLKKETVNE